MERLTGQRLQHRNLRFSFGESVHVKRNPDITNTLQIRVYDCIALYRATSTSSEWIFLSLDSSLWQEIHRPVRDAILMPLVVFRFADILFVTGPTCLATVDNFFDFTIVTPVKSGATQDL